jgi:hypothetical protein
MLTVLAFIGRWAWPAIGALIPGISPKLIMPLAAILAVLVAVGGPAGLVWLHMHGAKAEAVRGANSACELRIADGARISAESLSHLLDTIKRGEEAAVEPKTKAEEVAACKRSKLCREHAK